MRGDLGKGERRVVGVHSVDLLLGRGAQNFDNFDQLVHATVAGEQRFAQQKLPHDAPQRPNVYSGGVLSGLEHELRGTVVARADIRNIWLAPRKNFSAEGKNTQTRQ